MSLNSISYLEKETEGGEREREGGGERERWKGARERGGWAGEQVNSQAYLRFS